MEESENSFIVGGCTRDLLIGKEPKDFDFVTDISYSRLEEFSIVLLQLLF
jgi:tRNA nucleotidyltransferase/poly(A) polymerase